MNLHDHAVLVKLTVSEWDGFKKDKRAAQSVDGAFKTAGGAGNYNKRLLDRSVLVPLKSVVARIRSTNELYTVPWCYDGIGILPGKLVFPYSRAMDTLREALSVQTDNLISQYPVHIANQRTLLGDLFDVEDYPSADELRAKFALNIQLFPVPQEGHFLVDLGADEQKIKADLTRTISDTQRAAVSTLYSRVDELLAHMHTRLSDPDAIFQDTTVTKIQTLVNLLPDLNIFGDPTLAQACNEIQAKIIPIAPQRLRDDPALRKQVAEDAFDIVTLLRGAAA